MVNNIRIVARTKSHRKQTMMLGFILFYGNLHRLEIRSFAFAQQYHQLVGYLWRNTKSTQHLHTVVPYIN